MILDVARVDTFYGTSHVLQGIELAVEQGESVALLGRNGVGKTTTLRSIMGLTPPRAGSIRFEGREIRGLTADAISRLGIAYVPDDHRIFPTLTADENLEIARRLSRRDGFWNRDLVLELFPKLKELLRAKGVNLSGGERKMLAIGRALMANPSLILLDEPSEGLAPVIVEQMAKTIRELKAEGLTVLLSEQNLHFAALVADRATIIEKGRIRYTGTMEDLAKDEAIQQEYLSA
jgi:branched-chain amino acid transport system ATP-binding protein